VHGCTKWYIIAKVSLVMDKTQTWANSRFNPITDRDFHKRAFELVAVNVQEI
jgi:hypothetical protein